MSWKGCGRKRSWRNSVYIPGICLKGLGKITKTIGCDSLYLGLNSKRGCAEWKSKILSPESTHSVRRWGKLSHARADSRSWGWGLNVGITTPQNIMLRNMIRDLSF
jgi:hypothetical protein